MMVSAALEAKAQNFSLVCNKFDPRDARMATIEYVFYLSKVRLCARNDAALLLEVVGRVA